MVTTDFTFAFSDTGVILNSDPTLPNDPFVDITKVSGLSNTEFRITEREREGMDGGFVDAAFEKMRVITLEGQIFNATETYLDTLKANFAPSTLPKPFYFLAPGIPERLIYCKSYGMKYDWSTERRFGSVPCQFQLMAEDPTIYGDLLLGTAVLPTTTSGFGFDLSFNFGFGGASAVDGSTTLVNAGNKDADCTFNINGPISNPVIVHELTGNRLAFNIDLVSTDVLTVNLRNKTAVLNGSANRRGTMLGTSRWFLLSPGANTIRFLGTAGSGTPSLDCIARSAYR